MCQLFHSSIVCKVAQANGGGDAAVAMNNGAYNGGNPEVATGGDDAMMVDQGNANQGPQMVETTGGDMVMNGGGVSQVTMGGDGDVGGVGGGGDALFAAGGVDVMHGGGGDVVAAVQNGGDRGVGFIPTLAKLVRPSANAPMSVWAQWAYSH